MTNAPVRGLEEHVSFEQLRSIVGDALHATAHGSGHRVVWPARYAAHVDLLLRLLAQQAATIAALRVALAREHAMWPCIPSRGTCSICALLAPAKEGT